MPALVSWLLLGLMAVLAAGGYFQVATSPVFWCGRCEAFPSTELLAVIALLQSGAYLATAVSPRWDKLYRATQILVLPVLALALFRILLPHPWAIAFFATLLAIGLFTAPRGKVAYAGLFLVTTLGLFAALGQIPFVVPGVTVPHWIITVAALLAVAGAVAIVRTTECHHGLARLMPLSLLLFPVLRAKLPDIAYDSLSYKTTIPYQMAEWLTGDSAIVDGYMVGTNLQEMLNALLVALTGDWLPPFISTLSYLLLALIVPLAFPAARFTAPAERVAVAFAGLSAFTLTEAGIAQGTSYQEPLMLLFLAASLIRTPAWPGILAMAVAVKINAGFIAPLIVLYHAKSYRAFWISKRYLAAGFVVAAMALAPQIARNVAFSGRILGMNEILSAITDPPGPSQVMVPGRTRYDEPVRGGIVNNAVQSACNIWLLEGVCSVRYDGMTEAGFNVFPASRAAIWGLGFVVAAWLALRSWLAGLTAVLFLGGYLGFLAMLSEGRYFLPLSFGFSVLVLIERAQAASVVQTLLRWPVAGTAFACFLIGSDLIPGTFTNVSWICQRDLTAPVESNDLRKPETPVQSFLAELVSQYKQACPPPGLPPVILAETDSLNSPYLGTQRIFHVFTQAMISRFLAANPRRQADAADAILALVSEHPAYRDSVLGTDQTNFTPCYDSDGMHVLCSIRLAPIGPQCARSLY